MVADSSDTAEWRIETVSADEEGCLFYLDHYKPFRLMALQQDPDGCPLAKTFAAGQSRDKTVLSATSLLGPLPDSQPASNPSQVIAEMSEGDDRHDCQDAAPMCFQMASVYTRSEARGRGLAKRLVKVAMDDAVKQAQERGRALSLSFVVYATNTAAIAFYESCGFVASAEGPTDSFNPLKNSTSGELNMFFRAAS
ncbi:Uu.00g014230.m01.CDS01 [Anthostomella pinea]|uniref:Uu.00g014230.m01.CDS01 n=1 Tax=Anthostomella pinea TaxID=933095 RepID=A0AAI8VYZ1_9PEZI|nr:Uu.00g014230.m01.CDS01 [Anthostomella pinea]